MTKGGVKLMAGESHIEDEAIRFALMIKWGYEPFCVEKAGWNNPLEMAQAHINYDIHNNWPLTPGTSLNDEDFWSWTEKAMNMAENSRKQEGYSCHM